MNKNNCRHTLKKFVIVHPENQTKECLMCGCIWSYKQVTDKEFDDAVNTILSVVEEQKQCEDVDADTFSLSNLTVYLNELSVKRKRTKFIKDKNIKLRNNYIPARISQQRLYDDFSDED